MASDFHRPRSWMASLSTPAHRRAVAPPGRNDFALMSEGSIPVTSWTAAAAWRRPLVMNLLVTLYQVLS